MYIDGKAAAVNQPIEGFKSSRIYQKLYKGWEIRRGVVSLLTLFCFLIEYKGQKQKENPSICQHMEKENNADNCKRIMLPWFYCTFQ